MWIWWMVVFHRTRDPKGRGGGRSISGHHLGLCQRRLQQEMNHFEKTFLCHYWHLTWSQRTEHPKGHISEENNENTQVMAAQLREHFIQKQKRMYNNGYPFSLK